MRKMEELLKQQQEILAAIAAEYKRSREAAAQGESIAQYNLGVIYCKGQGVQQNLTEACRYFKLAAEQGHVDAQIELGGLYEHGHGVSKDLAESVRLYSLAVAQGSVVAHCRLGYMLESGLGSSKTTKKPSACTSWLPDNITPTRNTPWVGSMKTTMVWNRTMRRRSIGTNRLRPMAM